MTLSPSGVHHSIEGPLHTVAEAFGVSVVAFLATKTTEGTLPVIEDAAATLASERLEPVDAAPWPTDFDAKSTALCFGLFVPHGPLRTREAVGMVERFRQEHGLTNTATAVFGPFTVAGTTYRVVMGQART